jgi:hypothetical protein
MVKKSGTEPAADSGNRNGLVKSKDSQNREKSHSQLDDLKELRDSLKERGFLPDWRIIAGLCVLILGAILLVGILWSIPSIKAADTNLRSKRYS